MIFHTCLNRRQICLSTLINSVQIKICVSDAGHWDWQGRTMYTCKMCCGCIQHYYTDNTHRTSDSVTICNPIETYELWHLVLCFVLNSSWHSYTMASVSPYLSLFLFCTETCSKCFSLIYYSIDSLLILCFEPNGHEILVICNKSMSIKR